MESRRGGGGGICTALMGWMSSSFFPFVGAPTLRLFVACTSPSL